MIKIFYALYNNPLMQIEISSKQLWRFVMLAKIGVKSLCVWQARNMYVWLTAWEINYKPWPQGCQACPKIKPKYKNTMCHSYT